MLQQSDILSLYQLYSNPGVFIPALHYSFDQWTTGTTVINEGTLGSNLDATISHCTCVSNIIQSPAPTGNSYLLINYTKSQVLVLVYEYININYNHI